MFKLFFDSSLFKDGKERNRIVGLKDAKFLKDFIEKVM